MGTLFNKAFRGSTIEARKAEVTKGFAWSSMRPATEVIDSIRATLALTSERKMVSLTYYVLEDLPHQLTIGYGKKLANAFVVKVTVTDVTGGGHQGLYELDKFVTQDAMPIHVDKVTALRDQVKKIVTDSGAAVEDVQPQW